MRKEVKTQAKVGVGVEAFWSALSKDLTFVLPKAIPNLVKDVQVIEGIGGLGTVMLFNFGSDVPNMMYQKEKIVEFDESLHIIAQQVIEGGHLNFGFTSYKTIFQLTASGESETTVDFMVVYETEAEEETHMPLQTTKSTLTFIKCLENYLLNQPS
ncbi:phytohormone-binding protein-like [Cornus florida]|uniref:phytohormone-binding protein-like n=1 Tax=Cornus florida TaxID=4283 RepID=UPI002899C023|nr:phytohormone-binding protein-like [Cornus florida]